MKGYILIKKLIEKDEIKEKKIIHVCASFKLLN